MYEPSTDRSRGVTSEAGSLQQQSSMMKNASDPSLRSTGSSFADLGDAAYRHAGGYARHEEDIFSAVGGMELGDAELDSMGADVASTSGHEPHSEPSRTLFVRHISPTATDEELHAMFKVFGDVRHIYTVSKHRGFVMVTYFDLRAAARAQAALHGAPLSGTPLEVTFCAPKGDATVNQGTVTVFNLDPDTSNDHLVWLFHKFGDVKDIRESPDRSNQKFITFFDTRHALAALRAMNKAEHLGKLPANITPQLAASLSQMTMHDTSGAAAAAMEAQQRQHYAAGGGPPPVPPGSWDPSTAPSMDALYAAQAQAQAQVAALAASKGHPPSRASSQPGTTSPSPLPGTSPAGPAYLGQRGQQDQQQLAAPLGMKYPHPHGGMPGPSGHPHPGMEGMQGSGGPPSAAGSVRGNMHVSDSASSMSSVAGPGAAASHLLAVAAAAGRSPLGVGPHGPHGHSHGHKAVPSLATLSEAQALEEQAAQAGLYAAAANSMLAAGGGGAGDGGGGAADVNATASMLMGLQLGATPEQQLWALQQMAGAAAVQGGAANAAMWNAAAAANSLYGPGAQAAAAANLQAFRLQQELQVRQQQQQQQQQQQLALAANLATLQGQALSAAELNAAAAQLLHMAGLGQALGQQSAAAYLQPAAAAAAASLAGVGGLAGLSAAGLGGLSNAAAAQQLLQQAMGMGGLGALGSMQAALAGQGGSAGRLGSSYGSLGSLGGGHGGPHGHHAHHGAGGGRDGGAGSRGGGRLSRRTTDPAAELERKMQQEKLYALDPVKIRSGEDKRTTLMVKNIPNKYTQKMLLATIDEQFKGCYDFFYLPIDFKNKCNVGYAFINMINPFDIIALVERFNNRRWERFNSEKVCSISYARIQGRAALVAHFQNSSLMHEDKRCRPILFTANGTETTDPEAFQNDPSLVGTGSGSGAGPSGSGSASGSASASAAGSVSGQAGGGSGSGAGPSMLGPGGQHGSAVSVGGGPGAATVTGPARLRAAAAAAAAASSGSIASASQGQLHGEDGGAGAGGAAGSVD
ncbi:hypothetical protein HYH03_010732 [Edaphochlamys debaryana]|uniref:RRM domain-containing protein n=1 Tax=Edaphochlamys debaryana TaxID=47281 RepID=A0A836BVV5_9CHLO|nr:hypothetical protein HYH03_010732 [Edaphochlamys debaryana]|eukprot:KAG2490810.1 hypothetical protein HYH03_010732 [Edaphochlamys debaryana]